MPTKSRKKRKNKTRTLQLSGRRLPISDVPHTDTNIRVKFRSVVKMDYVSNVAAVPLSSNLFHLSQDLSLIYKLYRFTKMAITFQASQATSGYSNEGVAIMYVPALDKPPSPPSFMTDFSGPACGYFEEGRGTPYTFHIPMTVLNAMPYNWYNTTSNDPEASDEKQGYLISKTQTTANKTIYMFFDVTMEFQTLEDPTLISERVKNSFMKNFNKGDKREASVISSFRGSE